MISYPILRLILALSEVLGLHAKVIDFETAFLNALIEEGIYVHPPSELNLPPDQVIKRNMSLHMEFIKLHTTGIYTNFIIKNF